MGEVVGMPRSAGSLTTSFIAGVTHSPAIPLEITAKPPPPEAPTSA
jgi:hypothetical protein